MPNQNGNGFPSMDDLLFLKSMNALTPDQVKVYYEGNAINAQQAAQLGYKPLNTMAQPNKPANASAAPQSAKAAAPKSSSVNVQTPKVNPSVNPNTNPTK